MPNLSFKELETLKLPGIRRKSEKPSPKTYSSVFISNRGELICLTCKKLLCYKCAFIGGHKDHVCKEIVPAKESLLKRIDQITGMNARKAQKLVDVGTGSHFYIFHRKRVLLKMPSARKQC